MSITDDTLNTLITLRNRMQTEGSAETRADAAQHLASLFGAGGLAAPERQIALAIFEKLARDVELRVRQTLALNIATCPDLPAALARAIAADEDAVSLPFIRLSPALPDDDLLAIVATGNTAKQIAIASRSSVSEAVSGALVATHDAAVVTAVLGNEGAALGEAAYHEIIDHFSADNLVQGLLVERAALPLAITERLIQSVSDSLRERLIEKHRLAPGLATALAEQAGEQTLASDAADLPNRFDAEMLAARLHAAGKLTPTLLMRALTMGDRRFFEVSLATLAGIPPDNAATLIADDGELGFKSLYEQAGLPPELFRAFRAALDVLRETTPGERPGRPADPVGRILERVQREYDNACPSDLQHLISQAKRRPRGGALH